MLPASKQCWHIVLALSGYRVDATPQADILVHFLAPLMTAGQGRSSGTHLLLHDLDHSPTMSTNSHAKNGISRRGLKQEAAEVAVGKNGATSVSSSSHWTLLVLFLSLLVDLIGFTVILPLIPSMLEYYSKNDQV